MGDITARRCGAVVVDRPYGPGLRRCSAASPPLLARSAAPIHLSTSRRRVYARVTAKIIADLEQGTHPWFKPWNAEHAAGRITRPLRHNGTPYRGINVLMLWGEAMAKGFACPIWMTYKQAQELGAQVRKGEHGSLVVFADRVRRTETNDKGEDVEREIPFLKGYTVFNCEQIDGLPAHYTALAAPVLDSVQRIATAERFFAATGADIRHGGNRACYSVQADTVQMPPFETFRDAESYYATLAHEMTHWTRHPSRLDREFGRKRWGDEGYAAEELVAELGSAFLSADLDRAPRLAAARHRPQGPDPAPLSGLMEAPMLKLAKLPDRTPVRIIINVSPDLNRDLAAYAGAYRQAYGREESVAELIPFMLEAFLAGDRDFAKTRKGGTEPPVQAKRPSASGGRRQVPANEPPAAPSSPTTAD